MNHGKSNEIRVLVVDDEPEMRSFIADYLRDMAGYTVAEAESGADALDNVLPGERFDIVLSDINMPGMKGFELLKIVREQYPDMKRVLITAYNVEDYLELAMKYDVGNIFIKTIPFNFEELVVLMESLLRNNIFGLKKHFSHPEAHHSFTIRKGDSLEDDARRIVKTLPEPEKHKKLELCLFEVLTNAVFYGIRNEPPDKKEEWTFNFELSDEEAISVTAMYDDKKHGIAILDNGGRLKKNDVLYWLHRQLTPGTEGVPVGLYDSHGRGFFIARKYIDRVIVNIERDKRTEIILMNYRANQYSGYKPLYINEI
ncbi:MAG: response regulator [Chitinivibrionales bacterium]|nr:response regulator [Chitinivibrionales bacterium]